MTQAEWILQRDDWRYFSYLHYFFVVAVPPLDGDERP
jgi:hypothetical protein